MKKSTFNIKENVSFIILFATIVFFSVFGKGFLSANNFINVLRQQSIICICAMGMMMIILTGGIDLSMGSVIGVVGALNAYMMTSMDIHPLVSTGICLVIAALYGLFNGVVIAKLHVPPMVATLATMTGGRGLCYVITKGVSIYGFSSAYKILGQGYIGPIPIPVILASIFVIIAWWILTQRAHGTYLYALGGNMEASRLCGINVETTLIKTYTLAGLFSGIAGIILLARLGSASAALGEGYEMDIITAVVLGGVSISGGSGKLRGTVCGVLTMGLLSNGLLILGLSDYYQMIAKCFVLLIAVAFDKNFTEKSTKALTKESAKNGK